MDMLPRKRASESDDPNELAGYRLKILVCLVVAELVFIGLFKLWPKTASQPKVLTITAEEAPITMNDIRITRQDNIPPAPGPPIDHAVMPSDQVIRDNIPEIGDLNFVNLNKLPTGGGGGNSEGDVYGHPENPPSVVKIVEPAVPDQAHRAGIRAELTVRFLVGKKGEVVDVSIISIKKYSSDMKSYKMVNNIGYGIIDATMKAAAQWRFRPAMEHGKAVRAYSTHIFTFGL